MKRIKTLLTPLMLMLILTLSSCKTLDSPNRLNPALPPPDIVFPPFPVLQEYEVAPLGNGAYSIDGEYLKRLNIFFIQLEGAISLYNLYIYALTQEFDNDTDNRKQH